MRIVLVTNFNGKGLEKDAELLERLLVSWGHETARAQYDEANSAQFDLAIWLEVFNQHLISLAPRHWLFANPEWTKPEFVRPIQRHCEKVLAKTRDAERELRSLFANVEYVGFMCEDRWDPSVVRQDKALHVGGSSGFKGTNEVIAAWREYRYYDSSSLPELTVITNSTMVLCEPTLGVTFHKRVDDAELRRLQNEARFHIMPSSYEGYGHAIHESQSVGAVILTTGAGPMAELKAPFEVPPVSKKRNNLAYLHEVSGKDIRKYIPRMLEQPNYEIARMSVEARARFERDQDAFQNAFRRVLEPPRATIGASDGGPEPQKVKIALLGNFRPPHSTENDLLWSLRDLGYLVLTFQEDEDRTEEILQCAKDCALLIYVHTHSWQTPGTLSLDELWKKLHENGTKTCSFHLDRYFNLNELDGRDDRIGIHPFWHHDCWTADGGNQDKFAEREVNHFWLPPAVVKRDCYIGEWKKISQLTLDSWAQRAIILNIVFEDSCLNF